MLYAHGELVDWVADPRGDLRMRRKAAAVLRQMLGAGEPVFWKITREGPNKLFRRTPVGGSGGSQWYLYWAPREVLAQVADQPVAGRSGDLFARAVRHHDETGWPLSPDAADLTRWQTVTGDFLAATGLVRSPRPAPATLPRAGTPTVAASRPRCAPLRDRILNAVDNSRDLTTGNLVDLLRANMWDVRVMLASLAAEGVLARTGEHWARFERASTTVPAPAPAPVPVPAPSVAQEVSASAVAVVAHLADRDAERRARRERKKQRAKHQAAKSHQRPRRISLGEVGRLLLQKHAWDMVNAPDEDLSGWTEHPQDARYVYREQEVRCKPDRAGWREHPVDARYAYRGQEVRLKSDLVVGEEELVASIAPMSENQHGLRPLIKELVARGRLVSEPGGVRAVAPISDADAAFLDGLAVLEDCLCEACARTQVEVDRKFAGPRIGR